MSRLAAHPSRIARSSIPPLIKRNTLLLASTQAFVGVGTQMVPTLGAIMVAQLLASAALAGIGTSLLYVGRFVVAYPIGWVADAFGRRVALLIGLVMSLVGTILIGTAMMSASFPVLVAGLLVFGLGVGAGQQLRLAAADLFPPARRAEGLGYVLTGSLVGALGGPLLITVATNLAPGAGIDPIAMVWLLVPIVLLPSMGLVFLIRPDPRDIAANLAAFYEGDLGPPPTVRPDAPEGTGLRVWFAHYPLRVAFTASFAAQGTMALIMAMTSLAFAHHGHALNVISLAVAIHVVGMFGFSIPLGRLTDRIGRRSMMLLGTILSALGAVLVPAAPDYWVITTGTFLVGLGWSCVNVSTSALIADMVDPLERGRAIGASDTLSGASATILPLLGGPLIELLGFHALTAICVAFMAVPFAMLLRLKESKPGEYLDVPAD